MSLKQTGLPAQCDWVADSEHPSIAPFSVAALPRILFGDGALDQLAPELARWGRNVLLVTGGQSFLSGSVWPHLQAQFDDHGLAWTLVRISGEPCPVQIDRVAQRYSGEQFDVVVAIGGGSALDAGKAIAGLLPGHGSVRAYLEGVGTPSDYHGPALPFVAVPTTAGTGSELTRNAVITETGKGGFKKSFRDDRLLARLALVDPRLLETCPPAVMLGNALDALTQLLESYVSIRASVFTDALARDGLRAFTEGFRPDPENPVRDYGQLAYAAMLSGICLTQAGLGSVHGFASPLGAFFGIPHGMACGTMLAVCTELNMGLIRARTPDDRVLLRYEEVARILTGKPSSAPAPDLAALLHEWTRTCKVPRLTELGVRQSDIVSIVAASRGSSMKTNPVVLSDEELASLLTQRL